MRSRLATFAVVIVSLVLSAVSVRAKNELPAKVPGDSLLVNLGMHNSLWPNIVSLERRAAPSCKARKLLKARISRPPGDVELDAKGLREALWQEEWLIDRCGKEVSYRIEMKVEKGEARADIELLPITASSSGEPNPPLPLVEQIPNLSDSDLAFAFLVAGEMLSTGIGVAHQAWAEARAKGEPGLESVSNTSQEPDGSTTVHTFKSFEELDRYVNKIRLFHTAAKAQIFERGFEKVGETYQANFGNKCSREWPVSGNVKLQRTEFFFILSQKEKNFIGAVVRNHVAIVFPGGFQPPLSGTITSKTIELSDLKECVVRLVRE